MGVCFDCLVVVDGQRDQQACLVPVAPGMRIETQRRGDVSIAAGR
jgi:NADH dehydrogenase/NADH:ubiquinone oxidoreductase subunit G